jgi:hypothetical protein
MENLQRINRKCIFATLNLKIHKDMERNALAEIRNFNQPLVITTETRKLLTMIAQFHELDSTVLQFIDENYCEECNESITDDYEKGSFKFRAFLYEKLQDSIEANIGTYEFKGI